MIDVQPGIISLLYVLLYDVILITMFDTALGHLMSYVYYRKVQNGNSLAVRSSDIPGVTSFLMGSLWTIPNMLALLVKFIFLGIMLYVEMNLDSVNSCPIITRQYTAFTKFNASDSYWKDNSRPVITLLTEDNRKCRTMSDESNEIWYYSVAFNLADNSTLVDDDIDDTSENPDSEFESYLNPNYVHYPTVQCLSHEKVSPKNVIPMSHVLDCASENNSSCRATSIETKLEYISVENNVIVIFGLKTVETVYKFEYWKAYNVSLAESRVEYNSSVLYCLRAIFGIVIKKSRLSCLLKANLTLGDNQEATLFEHWESVDIDNIDISRSLEFYVNFTKRYAGPIFEGHIDFGDHQSANVLYRLWSSKEGVNWNSLSGIIVGSAAVYTRKVMQVHILGPSRTKSTVPHSGVITTAVILLATLTFAVSLRWFIGKHDFPRYNTVSGLSFLSRRDSIRSTDNVHLIGEKGLKISAV